MHRHMLSSPHCTRGCHLTWGEVTGPLNGMGSEAGAGAGSAGAGLGLKTGAAGLDDCCCWVKGFSLLIRLITSARKPWPWAAEIREATTTHTDNSLILTPP